MSVDPGALFRELRPADDAFDPDSPRARASLERILAAPPQPPRRWRKGGAARRLALACAVGTVAVSAVALAPLLRSSPDVVARAAAALDQPGTILHFKAEVRARESAAERRAGRPDGHVDSVVESWQGEGMARSVIDGGAQEIVLDTRTGRAEQYLDHSRVAANAPGEDVIVQFDVFDRGPGAPGPGDELGLGAPLEAGVVGDLARLLERARAGEGALRLVGETTIRGVPAYELQLDFTVPTREREPMRMSRLIYVDRQDYMPLRVVERAEQETLTVTDYVDVDRLPIDDATTAQLRMSPHPGVQRVQAQPAYPTDGAHGKPGP